MNALQAVYASVLAAKNHAYARRWLQPRILARPVVSIGNLSLGGAGKTPFCIELAHLLTEQGFPVDVLSRGYGRRRPGFSKAKAERVDPHGTASRFGDEPLLLARSGFPVYVGASRYRAGLLAERAQSAGIHILDDGFGHRRLARSADIVLLHPSDIMGSLLPTGRLREPLSSLHRAHFLVLRDTDLQSEPALARAGIQKPIWRVRRTLTPPAITGPAVAFCAIAHPDEFFHALRAHGIALARTSAFRDHHRFRPAELEALAAAAAAGGAAAILTTEKDLARLSPAEQSVLAAAAPLLAVPLRSELLDPAPALAALAALAAHLALPPSSLA